MFHWPFQQYDVLIMYTNDVKNCAGVFFFLTYILLYFASQHTYFYSTLLTDEVLCECQVSCMNEICGMIPFMNSSHPDQFYRLFISLFIHVGSVVPHSVMSCVTPVI